MTRPCSRTLDGSATMTARREWTAAVHAPGEVCRRSRLSHISRRARRLRRGEPGCSGPGQSACCLVFWRGAAALPERDRDLAFFADGAYGTEANPTRTVRNLPTAAFSNGVAADHSPPSRHHHPCIHLTNKGLRRSDVARKDSDRAVACHSALREYIAGSRCTTATARAHSSSLFFIYGPMPRLLQSTPKTHSTR